MMADGRLDQFVQKRYDSYQTGIGKKIHEGKTDLESLCDYALSLKGFQVESGKQEYLESILNQILFG